MITLLLVSSPDLNHYMQFIQQILYSPTMRIIKFLFISITLFFIIHTIYLIYYTEWLHSRVRLYRGVIGSPKKNLIQTQFIKAWDDIQKRMIIPNEAEWKLALIEADQLLDKGLQTLSYKGTDMGDRLMRVKKNLFSSLDDIWRAHKIRNLLVHDTAYEVTFSEAQSLMQTYKKALEELGVLKKVRISEKRT